MRFEDIDDEFPVGDHYERHVGLMVSCLEHVAKLLPEVARGGIEKARQFALGAISAGELEDARVACWRFLDPIDYRTPERDPVRCAVSAAICLMYPPGTDALDLLDHFLRLLRHAGVPQTALADELSKFFGVDSE